MAEHKIALRWSKGDAPFGGYQRRYRTLNEIHHLAHDACFSASSLKTNVTVEPVWPH